MGKDILNWYKKINSLLKVVLFPLAILGGLLWLIGNLAHCNTLIMFIFGLIVGIVLYYFFGNPIVEWIKSVTIVVGQGGML